MVNTHGVNCPFQANLRWGKSVLAAGDVFYIVVCLVGLPVIGAGKTKAWKSYRGSLNHGWLCSAICTMIIPNLKINASGLRCTGCRLAIFLTGLFVIAILMLPGCEKNTRQALDKAALMDVFNANTTAFYLLKDMIIADSADGTPFQIGEGRIGRYSLSDKGWSKTYGQYVPFSVVTGTYNLTAGRYEQYLSLLRKAQATIVSTYQGRVFFTVLANGFVFGGCISEVIYHPAAVSFSKPSWALHYESVKFNENWGAETRCN